MSNDIPKVYPGIIRIFFAICAIILIFFTFSIMSKLTVPSTFVNALQIVKAGPKPAAHIQKLDFLNFKNYLYLVGSLTSVMSDQDKSFLFTPDQQPALPPTTFTDSTGSLEILASKMPLTAEPPGTYRYLEPYHLLGWRIGTTGFSLLAIGASENSLLSLLEQKADGWKSVLFINGLILCFLVSVIFWLLNMSLLSTPHLETVQLLIVNLVFLVLYYSVLLLSGYPLIATITITVKILFLGNLIFIPTLLVIQRLKFFK